MMTDWYYALRCRLLYHPHRLQIHHPEVTGWSWQDRDTILLCANFQILVDFVELELPQFSRWCDTKGWFDWCFSWFHNTRREPAKGIEHLEWAMSPEVSTDCPSQAEYAKEYLYLYRWWTVTRPARPNPWEAVPDRPGSLRDLFNDADDQDGGKAAYLAALHTAGAIEEFFAEEDDAHLIRLMKVRRGLWT